jgi:hypothetical protein
MTTVKEPPTRPKRASFFKSVISQLKSQRHPEALPNKPSDKLADPTRIGVLSDEPERRTSLNSSASRCQFTFADGRQCRMRQAHFCSQHSPKQKRGADGAALKAPELEALCSDLTTTTSINRALAQTFLLMAQGRISRKDAVAFGYLSQLLLQSISGVRAEYVAAFGYRQWETKLKTSLMPDADDDPDPSPGGDNIYSAVSFGKSGDSARTVIPSERSERGIPPKPLPVNNSSVDEQSISCPAAPDFADLYRRGRNLVEGKYDTTPEGRREANKLALDLELIKPAPAKPPRDFIGRVAHLQRTISAGHERNVADDPEPSSLPPEAFLNYYGHPIKLAVPYDSGTASPDCAHPNPSPSRSKPPTMAAPQTRSSGPGDFVAPPSRRHRKPRSHSSDPGCAPHPELPLPLPISATTAKPDSACGPDDEHHEGHRTDWYAPPSWSSIRKPDPCPSRKEKLQRKLRVLSNSAFRRLQHRNSRGL